MEITACKWVSDIIILQQMTTLILQQMSSKDVHNDLITFISSQTSSVFSWLTVWRHGESNLSTSMVYFHTERAYQTIASE